MKKIFTTVLILFFGYQLTAQSDALKWHHNPQEAIALSMTSKKPIMMFFTGSDWCGWCIKLQKEVFNTPEFKTWVADKYILLELDFPRRKQLEPAIAQQNAQLQNILQVRGYPTIYFIQPEQKEQNVNLNALARTGYVAGGPQKWIESVEQFFK